ncbi:MAG: acyltransferase [ANME-2 cluster archaeon]|nr:acyltransferase [ANME-2 cluster archaeon]
MNTAHRTLNRFPSRGKHNSLWHWKQVITPARLVFNYILMWLARYSPSFPFKLLLYRRMGIRIGNNVSIAPEVTMDFFFPHLIEIGDNTIIGYNSTILCHEFLIKEYVTGPVVIGRDVMVGANTTILPGVRIADGSVVSAHSLVNSDIEGFSGGVPARPLERT